MTAFDVSGGEGFRLTVTVRAEHPEILYPIVIPDPIDVVDLNAERLTPPLRYPTRTATIFKYTSLEQVPLYGQPGTLGKNDVKGPAAGSCTEFSAVDGLRPRGCGKSETLSALSVGVSCIVEPLHIRPIELPAPIVKWRRGDT